MSSEENGLDFDMSDEENKNLGKKSYILSSKPHFFFFFFFKFRRQ
jgi:hypothetical protein